MNSKILGLLVAGLLAGPMAANANGVVAGFDVVTDTESKFSGSFNFIVHQGGDYDVASSHGLLPFLDPNPDDDDTPVCNLFGNRNWGNDANFGSGFLLAACPGTPQNPEFTGALNDSAQSFSPVGGLFTNSAAGVPVYWSFTALQDTGTIDGVFSGAFCFSRVDGVCSASTVPEPGTLALLGVGLAGLAASRRRKR